MCHKNRAPRCSSCNKPAPRHRCQCPANHASSSTVNTQYDGLPTYAETIEPQPPTSTALPISVQPRCGDGGDRGYGGCGYRKRPCRGPIRLLVGLVVRKAQEKKEGERLAATLSDDRAGEKQERGVVDTLDEKQMDERERKEEEKDEDVKVLTKSVGSISL